MTDTWLTPPAMLRGLGVFDLDPCAAIEQPWPTAGRHYTVADNGLARAWFGRVWLNPPYSAAAAWMGRMATHRHGIALVFAKTGTDWWRETIWTVATAILFLRGRQRFHTADGTPARFAAACASALVAYGQRDADTLAGSELDGAFVPLANGQAIIVVPERDVATWFEVVVDAFHAQGGELALARLYVLVGDHPKTRRNRHWKAKLRQQVQGPAFRRVGRGQYELLEATT